MNLVHKHSETEAYKQLVYWLLGENKVKWSSSLICASSARLNPLNICLEVEKKDFGW